MSRLRMKFKPSEISEMLGTGYSEFESSTGIHGLAKITDGTLSLLAVNATAKGKGQFRKFISQAKRKFKRIEVIEVWNLVLRQVLVRYGFEPTMSDEFVWSSVDTDGE